MHGTIFLMKLTGVIPPVSHDAAIAALKSARGAIEQSSDLWSTVLIWSTGIVAAGVVLEIIAEAMEVRKDRKEGKKIEPFHFIAFIAAAVVALFVAVEGVAEFKVASKETELRENNSAEQLELQASANDAKSSADNATKDAVDLAKRVGGIDALVAETDRKLSGIEADEVSQKARSDAIIAALDSKEREVTARIAVAKKEEADLRDSVNTLTALREEIHALTADRSIDVHRVAEETKAFAKTPFGFVVSDDRDAVNLADLIGQALESAAWNPQDDKRSDKAIGFVKTIRGREALIAPGRGVTIIFAQSDGTALGAAAKALTKALSQEKLKYVELQTFTPELMEKSHISTGLIHIWVGARQ